MTDKEIYSKVYKILRQIPRGKATTYGSIAKRLHISPRFVGRILSVNQHPERYPCYKVVRVDGSLGGYTVDDKNNAHTLQIKKNKLLADGVAFHGGKVDASCLV